MILPENRTCVSSDLLCSKQYMQCKQQQMDPAKDRCAINFAGRTGEVSCTNPRYLGLAGCKYDFEIDGCYTDEECACSGEYFTCTSRNDCIDSQSLATFTDLCAQQGCTAAHCCLDSYSCNQTGLVCANLYLQCALEDVAEGEIFNYRDELFCEASFCLRRFFSCMLNANCTLVSDLKTHISICVEGGCTLEGCGVIFEEETLQLPNAPQSMVMRCKIDMSMNVTWRYSELARLWMKTGSANMNQNYKVLFEGDCTRGGPCGHVLIESNIAALGLKQVVYGGSLYGLTIGTMYKVSISATNIVGIGAAASKHQILAGVPGQPQDSADAQGVGAMMLSFSGNRLPIVAMVQQRGLQLNHT